jgi:hypothetical protein
MECLYIEIAMVVDDCQVSQGIDRSGACLPLQALPPPWFHHRLLFFLRSIVNLKFVAHDKCGFALAVRAAKPPSKEVWLQ